MKKICLAVLLTALLFMLMGCTSLAIKNIHEYIEEGEYGTPKTHTLLFGIPQGPIHHSSVFLQQNPKFGYYFCELYTLESEVKLFNVIKIKPGKFFLVPHEAGSEYKEFKWTEVIGKSINDYYCGIAGVDFVLTKPGLQYYGEDDEKHSKELKTLKKMYKFFANTEWGDLIQSRIEEILNEK